MHGHLVSRLLATYLPMHPQAPHTRLQAAALGWDQALPSGSGQSHYSGNPRSTGARLVPTRPGPCHPHLARVAAELGPLSPTQANSPVHPAGQKEATSLGGPSQHRGGPSLEQEGSRTVVLAQQRGRLCWRGGHTYIHTHVHTHVHTRTDMQWGPRSPCPCPDSARKAQGQGVRGPAACPVGLTPKTPVTCPSARGCRSGSSHEPRPSISMRPRRAGMLDTPGLTARPATPHLSEPQLPPLKRAAHGSGQSTPRF